MTEKEPVTLERLEARVRSYGASEAMVAVSGGVDSAVVLAVAARVIERSRVTAVTAISPSYPAGELQAARDVASFVGVEHRTVETGEVDRPDYARNDALRCFHCKTELYTVMGRLASLHRGPGVAILAGANADDRTDFRPGLRAAEQFGVRNPLLEEAVSKREVRGVARHLGLPVADKPALACLSSRVAFGVPITPDLLSRIDRAEQAVRRLGFEQVRVRHLGDRASIEVAQADVPRLAADHRLAAVVRELRAMGWDDVRIDPLGYRPGAMNATLVELQRAR